MRDSFRDKYHLKLGLKERSHFRVDCQKPANRNHAKIRNHQGTIARDVTDGLCPFKVKQGVLLMYLCHMPYYKTYAKNCNTEQKAAPNKLKINTQL